MLISAGLVEVAWAQSIQPTQNFTRPAPTALCLLLMCTAVYLLSLAMNNLPVAIAYVVFSGIGAIGAIVVGVVAHHDPVSIGRVTATALIVAGIVLAHLATEQPEPASVAAGETVQD
ncbi:DMT family transporter [Rhodococcus sp. NPDC127528]|uniref:DMT family transporter n=1 Tax=unclassified Rhodococcus (in: high G+C Gram-positive bacteria) TaxID=192944 RepID=UPI00362A1055